MSTKVTLIPGDGIGPSISRATVRLLDAAGADIEWDEQVAGHGGRRASTAIRFPTRRSTRSSARARAQGSARDAGRRRLSLDQRRAAKDVRSLRERPTGVLHPAGRPLSRISTSCSCARTPRGCTSASSTTSRSATIRARRPKSIAIITREGSERIVRYAFEYAVKHGRKKVTLVHKANILKFSQGLFLDVGRMVARDYAGRIEFEERIVDAMAMNLVLHPERFDVIVTTNLFGDILSDQISGLVGGLGLAPGANIGAARRDLRGGARHRAGHRRQGHRESRAR